MVVILSRPNIHETNGNLFTGLLTSTGKKWHQRRKIITPSFHFKILEHFTEIMESQGQIFITNLKKYEGQHCDFFALIGLYALDVICGELHIKFSHGLKMSNHPLVYRKRICNGL